MCYVNKIKRYLDVDKVPEKMCPMVARVQWVCVYVTERFCVKYVSRVRELFLSSKILHTVIVCRYKYNPDKHLYIKPSCAPTKGGVES